MSVKNALLLGTLFWQLPTLGQNAASSKPSLSSAKLFEDVDVLERVYELAHPGLYRYSTKAQMDGHFPAALRAEFARDRTLPNRTSPSPSSLRK